MMPTVAFETGNVRLLDQTRLPAELTALDCRDLDTLIDAIQRLVVRGAPAIGVAGAYGAVLAMDLLIAADAFDPLQLARDFARLRAARPTAVNLGWAISRMEKIVSEASGLSPKELREALFVEAKAIHEEDVELCERMAEHGLSLLPDPATVITHCNTGALATAGIGTALGVVIHAHQKGRKIEVYADETRPLLQGARLTAYECREAGIPVHVLADGAAAWLMKTQKIDAVLIGSDRIAANGDVANKIGSYHLAIAAKRHGVPFYVVAPYSTLDMSLASGDEIPIELRSAAEVHHALGARLAPEGVGGFNPAFDVTPAELVSAIVTEKGVFRAPYTESLGEGHG